MKIPVRVVVHVVSDNQSDSLDLPFLVRSVRLPGWLAENSVRERAKFYLVSKRDKGRARSEGRGMGTE